MDSGYLVGGYPGGMMYFPPKGIPQEPYLIPWEELLDEEEPEPRDEDTNGMG